VRILFLTHRLPYAPNRGDRIRAYHMLRQLSSQHRVDLVSLVHDRAEEAHAESLRDVADSVTTARVRLIRKAIGAATALMTGRPLTHGLLDAPDIRDRLCQVVARSRPDVVLAYCSGMARFALEAPLRDFPLVLDMVDVDSEKWSMLGRSGSTPKHWIYRREASLLRAFEAVITRAAATTVVVNDRERASLVAIAGAARIETVENGIDLAGFRSPRPPGDLPRVVFCGVMNYEPNEGAALWLANHVWPNVRASRPDATLLLVGANPTRRVRALAEQDRSIEVTGSVPDVRPYLWDSAVSVAPLFVARGLQNKVLEAAAAGLPTVVTSAVMNGLPQDVAAACRTADTAGVFTEHILQLLSLSAADRRAMAERATCDSLGWETRLAPLESILRNAAHPYRDTERVA
jgi:sugar transferase (PEP-CTERM/EpsH1 system associated)